MSLLFLASKMPAVAMKVEAVLSPHRSKKAPCIVKKRQYTLTLVQVNRYLHEKLFSTVKIGQQCKLEVTEDQNGKHTAVLSQDSSLQDLREILEIDEAISLRKLQRAFDMSELALLART